LIIDAPDGREVTIDRRLTLFPRAFTIAPPILQQTRVRNDRVKLSKRTEYGLKAIVQLARLWPTTYVQSRDLAKSEELPNKFLESILLALRRGGFLDSKVGSGGGYKLSRAPKDIAVGEVIRRLEGRLTINDREPIKGSDTSPGQLAVFLLNERLTDATDEVLDKMTLAELLEQINRVAGGQVAMYYI